MSSKRNEYHVDGHAKKAAILFVACKPNPASRVKIPDAMRIKGYSPNNKATDQALQMQVHHVCGPATRVKIPDAMRIKGYSPNKATDQALQMQMHCEVKKIKQRRLFLALPLLQLQPVSATAATSVLLILSTMARPAFCTIMLNLTFAPIFLTLPSPPKKTRKGSHQKKIEHQKEAKRKVVQG